MERNFRPGNPSTPADVNPYYQRVTVDATAAAASVQVMWSATPPTAGRPQAWSGGSGTVIGRDETRSYVLTCKHVAPRAGTVKVIPRGAGEGTYGQWVASDPVADLALLSVPLTSLPVAPVSDATVLHGGTGVFLIGRQFREVSGSIIDVTAQPGGERCMRLACVPISGDSGGGVFTANGQLVAVVSATDGRTTGYAVSLGSVRTFLQKCCFLPQRPAQPQPWTPPPQSPVIPPPPPPDGRIDNLVSIIDSLRRDIGELKARPAMPGPPGPPGPPGEPGPQGPAGRDADTAELRAELEALRGRVQQQEANWEQLNGSFRIRVQPKQ